MATETRSREKVSFGEFELDCRSGELRRNGSVLKLQQQPAKVLAILATRAGEVVTRQQLCEQLWGSGTHVDFEHGLNFAIRQIRTVLQDDAENPQYLETVPKRGYRFMTPTSAKSAPSLTEQPATLASPPHKLHFRYLITSLAGAVVAAGLIVALYKPLWRSDNDRRIGSLAVLPLHNLSSDPEQEYFSDGMTDELITDLAKSGGLRVISHTSVERYKGTKTPLPEIAKELRVDAIVEGTVMRSADKVRITAQLIDARSDRHLWADSYERDVKDVFSLQDEVARRIASEIGTKLVSSEQAQAANKRALDPVAHEAYLRGNFYWNQLNCDGFNKAREYFQQAVDRDPGFAPAYVGLAESYFALTDWGCSPDHDLLRKSKVAALKALELDPNSGEAHAWLGKLAFFYEWDFPKAEGELKQAIQLSPNYAAGHIIYAVFLITTGRPELGLAEMTRAHDIDPTSQLTNVIGVVVFYLARQYDDAIEQGRRTIELYPESVGAYDWLAYAYEKRGFYDQAIAAYMKGKELRGGSPKELSVSRTAYQQSGMHGFWQKELDAAQKNTGATPCWFANIYAHLDDRERALEFLNRSSQQHCSGPYSVIADPIFDDLRQDRKFKELIARLGL